MNSNLGIQIQNQRAEAFEGIKGLLDAAISVNDPILGQNLPKTPKSENQDNPIFNHVRYFLTKLEGSLRSRAANDALSRPK